MDAIQAVMIYLPLTVAICLAVRVLWRADRLINTIERLLKNHPPHSHNADGSIVYDPDFPPPITVQAHR